jgi:hypothetical protein
VIESEKRVSYEVQPTSDEEHPKRCELGMKMSENTRICDIIGELLHKLDSPDNQLCCQYPSSLQLW